ncbi:hypothetical protein TIFTF001_053182 [Ficus carica]|uniref:Uncharacterized protein n=1 Tax=Ficus carica TaxID=3494 RepID=A0AA88EGM8_FICCA|nr:hypothetical protein TIFTF001_053182 [Ficus carica]
MVRELRQCVGLHCPSWVACVPHTQSVFPPCCWASFQDSPIAPMVASSLMGVTLAKVAVADLAFPSPVLGVFLRAWDRGFLRLSPSGLITYVLSRWFMDFRLVPLLMSVSCPLVA